MSFPTFKKLKKLSENQTNVFNKLIKFWIFTRKLTFSNGMNLFIVGI